MYFRHTAERLLEHCASCFADPAERLKFLQRATAWSVDREHGPQVGKALGWAVKRQQIGRKLLPAGALAILIGNASAAAVVLQGSWGRTAPAPMAQRNWRAKAAGSNSSIPENIWLVETTRTFDLYSNGLRVENEFATGTETRKYRVWPRSGGDVWRIRSVPAGIVFHTTESHIAPFEEDQNQQLRRAGEGLLEYVSRKKSYHFVIDRFGRVYRIVSESDRANHAGHSIWADRNWVYIDLNESFFGVAFEARTRPDDGPAPLNSAQVHAGRILTDMLRARYEIPPENCIGHGQVSVNPGSRQAAYHTDWAAHLPFRELGLPDNYSQPLPSIVLFGFTADASFANNASPVLRQALLVAEDEIKQKAAAHNVPVERYRQSLQQTYQERTRALVSGAIHQENYP